MNYQEMLDDLVGDDDAGRTITMMAHWQDVFSDGFVGFVQGQIDAGRAASQPGSPVEVFFTAAGMDPAPLIAQAREYHQDLLAVWEKMLSVYAAIQRSSEQQGNAEGMAGHGSHTTMPAGVSVQPATNCYRCGSPVDANGLCSDCNALDADIEAHRQQDDQLRYAREQDALDQQRQLDNQAHWNNQPDFNNQDY